MMGDPPPPRPDLRLDGPGMTPVPGSLSPVDADGRLLATWRWWEVVGMTLVGMLLGLIAAAVIVLVTGTTVTQTGASGPSDLLAGIVSDVVLMATLLFWLRRRHPNWWAIIGFPSRRGLPKEAGIGAALGILVRIAAGIASAAVVAVLTSASNSQVKIPEQVDTNLAPAAFAMFVVYAVIVAPITEEFVFRGLLYRSIRDRRGVALGAIVSAVLFGLVHAVPGVPWLDVVALQITMVVTGVGLALIYERRKNLVSDIAGHAAFNLVAVVAIAAGAGFIHVPWHIPWHLS